MIFKNMSLEKAKEFYEELKGAIQGAKNVPLLKIAMDDIWFFTQGLTRDYGRLKNETNSVVTPEYIQLLLDI